MFISIYHALAGAGGAVSDIGAALIAFFATITDYTLWRSLGWMLLGIALIGGGVVLWVKTEVKL